MQHSILFVDKVFLKPFRQGEPLRGVEVFNLQLIRDLIRLNFTVTVLAERSWRDPLVSVLGMRMPEVVWVSHGGVTAVNALKGAVRVGGRAYDTLLIGNVGNGLIPALGLLRARRAFARQVTIAHRRPTPRFAARLAKWPGEVVAVNRVIADDFRSAGCVRAHVDYGVLNADRFFPKERTEDKGIVDFCVVGALDTPWKGADTAVRAFRQLPPEVRARCRLHLASYLHPPVFEDPRIVPYAWMPLDRMPEFLRTMDVMIVPSRDENVMRETFSQVAVQGMLSGLPVLHNALPILTEKFDRGGGLVFSSVPELAGHMRAMLEDPPARQRMGRQARETARQRYVWDTERFAERYLAPPVPPKSRPLDIPPPVEKKLGGFDALLAPEFHSRPGLEACLKQLPRYIKEDGVTLSEGRHRVVRIPDPEGEGERSLAVKVFGRQPLWKDWVDRRRGSKARRSFLNAMHLLAHGSGTPAPVAFLERWGRGRLRESYYVTRYEPGLDNFRDALIRFIRHDPDCARIMNLLESVAQAVAKLHRSGMGHGDLGNQNIALRLAPDGSARAVFFVDLNRGRMGTAGSLPRRAFDVSRLTMPSDFLRVFTAIYFGPEVAPEALYRWEAFYRKRFAWHTWTRKFRHPLRTAKRRGRPVDTEHTYPPVKEMWIWDERSAQAIATMRRRERKQHYPRRNAVTVATSVALALKPVRDRYKPLLATTFKQPVNFADRIGVAVHPRRDTWEREREWLSGLGTLPVIARFYHHEQEADWAFTAAALRALKKAGHSISIALVQDRRAVREPASWHAFVNRVLEEMAPVADWVEAGHAINRVKWGLWTLEEYARLFEPFIPYCGGDRGCRIMGPAVIDFEYQYLVAVLRRLKGQLRFDALSHHLYVDRRGAPENLQAGYGTVEKCALARAIADWAPSCEPRLIVSEVNWPLAGTGVYSPVNSPYIVPGQRTNDPSVSEDLYADYMLRYLVLALASGMAERVYWWRLAAHGFGLVDDRGPKGWTARPAYSMLRHFLEVLGQATFVKRLESPPGVHAYLFRRRDGERVILAYAHPEPVAYLPAFAFRRCGDALDVPIEPTGGMVLRGRPVLFRGVSL